MLNWLFVDLNAYFASVEQQVRPELRGKPIIVVPSDVDTTCAIAASYQAKSFGIKTGTLVREAKKICPGLCVVEARPRLYVDFHHKIIEAVESCLPVTAVMSIDEMACKLRGSDQIPKNAIQIAHNVKKAIRTQVGDTLGCSVGIAPNRFLAKVASDMQKPDGLIVIESHEIPEKILKLKSRDLPGIGHQMEQKLLLRGIRTVGDLWALSKAEMKSAWGGIVGEKMYGWIRGEDHDWKGLSEQKSVGHSHVLPPELRTMDLAFAIAQKLTHKAAARMRKLGFWARGFSLYVRYMMPDRKIRTWGDSVKLLECQDTFTVLEALRELWIEAPIGKPFAVGVCFFNFVTEEEHTLGLFGGQKKQALSDALDGINGKFGNNALYYGGIHHVRDEAPTRISFTNVPELEFSKCF